MVCVSPSTTANGIKEVSDCHDSLVHFWKDDMKDLYPVSCFKMYNYILYLQYHIDYCR